MYLIRSFDSISPIKIWYNGTFNYSIWSTLSVLVNICDKNRVLQDTYYCWDRCCNEVYINAHNIHLFAMCVVLFFFYCSTTHAIHRLFVDHIYRFWNSSFHYDWDYRIILTIIPYNFSVLSDSKIRKHYY